MLPFTLLLLLFFGLPALSAASPATNATHATDSDPALADSVLQLRLDRLYGNPGQLPLKGTDGNLTVPFGLRNDKLVDQAMLHLHYKYSPSLIPGMSHIKVLLNDELIGILPITHDNPGQQAQLDIPVDPRLLVEFNRLRFQFIGHYSNDCEDPQNTTLWAAIDGGSKLELHLRSLPLDNDLGRLPAPFFTRGDEQQLILPVVFPATPNQDMLHAAGVVASWFGALSDWRGARFPVSFGSLPAGHALVFVSAASRPAWLDPALRIDGPMLAEMTNPTDGTSKLLLVMGRNGREIDQAALSLVLGHAALSGDRVSVGGFNMPSTRVPYDAPRWIRLDRPVKFGELVDSPMDLERTGHEPDAVRLNLRMPPDLFGWRSRGIPLDVKFHYSPVHGDEVSRLTVSANNQLVEGFNLRSGRGTLQHPIELALDQQGLFGEGHSLFLPSYKLGTRNQLQFAFSFAWHKTGRCEDTQTENAHAAVDADSTIDFSQFLHYTELPNLNYFASLGYPFTRQADLSETVAVLPTQPSAHDIETLLDLLGHLSAATGYPATHFRLAGPDDESKLKDADLLVIGSSLNAGLLAKWKKSLPANLVNDRREASQPQNNPTFTYDWFEFGSHPDPTPVAQEDFIGNGPLALLIGFESPLSPHRSVVAFVASDPARQQLALDALNDSGKTQQIQGSEAFFHSDHIDSYLVGQLYSVGHLPWWVRLWLWLSRHPALLILFAVIAAVVATLRVRRALNAITRRRLESDHR